MEAQKKKVKKPSAEVLQRRKEGRIKAAAALASNLKKTGIMRVEDQNNFPLSTIKPIPLINQKNYYTDYLKRDEQLVFVRRWRAEKMLKQKLKKLKQGKQPEDNENGETRNFDDFNLNEIEQEMKKKVEDEDEEEEDEDEENGDVDVDGEATDEVMAEKAKIGSDVIVLHPGSSNFRIGRAVDAVPVVVPSVVAVPRPTSNDDYLPASPVRTGTDSAADGASPVDMVSFGPEFENVKAEMTKDFKARMRFYKRRVLPNSRETASNFNKRQEPEVIPEHNDPNKVEWIETDECKKRNVFVGDEALKLPLCDKFGGWKLRHPILNGRFNEDPEIYGSKEEILGDLTHLVDYGLKQLEIEKAGDFKCVLIIPDLYDKMYVETLTDLLIRYVGFKRVAYIQESLSASFGAGTSSACIIDVGSQTTTVSCVDEGLVINDSRIKLNFGGDNITETFTKFLLQQHFPYKDINLNYSYDWQLAQTLKHDFITFNDADIAVQIYNFYKRKPFEDTLKYEFKVFDEVMLSPLGLFFPQIFDIKHNNIKKFFSPSVDQYSSKSNNPYSKSQDNIIKGETFTSLTDEDLLSKLSEENKNLKSNNPFGKAKFTNHDLNDKSICFPLEKAIIESITNAGLATDFGKVRKFYSNLLFVGGGISKIPGFDLLITDRINIWRPKFLTSSSIDEVFEYIEQLETQSEEQRKELVQARIDKKKQNGEKVGNEDESSLSEEEIRKIDQQCQIAYDLDHIDAIVDRGQLLPVTVLPPPREFDPEILTWKGAAVFGRLKVADEMWISPNEWDLLGSRCLYYKSLFNY